MAEPNEAGGSLCCTRTKRPQLPSTFNTIVILPAAAPKITDGTQPEYLRGLYSATLKIDHQFGDQLNLSSISSYFHSYSDVTVDVDKGGIQFLIATQWVV